MKDPWNFRHKVTAQLHLQGAKTALSLGGSGSELGGRARADTAMIGLLIQCHVKVRGKF